jgi:hypothetical protein
MSEFEISKVKNLAPMEPKLQITALRLQPADMFDEAGIQHKIRTFFLVAKLCPGLNLADNDSRIDDVRDICLKYYCRTYKLHLRTDKNAAGS